jgi:hypothetical protein
MSTLKTNTIQHLTSGFSNIVTHTDGAGTVNAAHCRAWVNFDGTAGTISPRASFNVSSITDNGTGDYTVNFSNAMSDANYSVFALPGDVPVPNRIMTTYRGFVLAGSCRIICGRPGNASLDEDPIMFGMFR